MLICLLIKQHLISWLFSPLRKELCVIIGDFCLYFCRVWRIKPIKVCQYRVNLQGQADTFEVSIWASPSCRNPNSCLAFWVFLPKMSPN